MLRTHRAGKPWELWGVGLGSRNRRGPGVPPTLGLRGQGISPGSPAGFLGSRGQDKRPPLLSCFSQMAPPTCLSLYPQPPLQPGWGFGGQGIGLEAQQAPHAQVGGAVALAPLPLLPDDSSCFCLLISMASLLCPQGPTQPGAGLGGKGTGLGAQQASCA